MDLVAFGGLSGVTPEPVPGRGVASCIGTLPDRSCDRVLPAINTGAAVNGWAASDNNSKKSANKNHWSHNKRATTTYMARRYFLAGCER
jgi:hypothetical protein